MTAGRHNYKLNEAQRQAIVVEYLAGDKLEAIAARYGVHQSYPRWLAKARGFAGRKNFTGICPHCGANVQLETAHRNGNGAKAAT
jgi:hypothetical protein